MSVFSKFASGKSKGTISRQQVDSKMSPNMELRKTFRSD